jgi:hemoglobin
MGDIENRTDIDALLRAFYAKAIVDDTIGYIFTDVAKLDLDHHLPIIGDFWDSMLFGKKDYQNRARNPMQIHADLHMKSELNADHFNRWLEIFSATVDEMFTGERAELVKFRARNIGMRMLNMVSNLPDMD